MKKSYKNLAIIIITVLICLTANPAHAMSPEKQTNEITIDFWHHYSAQSAENETLTNVLIPKFESENPGIKVNAVSHEWGELHDKILISANTGELPDVARCDIAWLPEFQKMGILVPLDTEMPDFKAASDALLESAMSTAQINGNYYGLGLNTNTKILFYNKKMLEKAGVNAPQTMEELASAIRAIAGKNEQGQQIWGWDEPSLSCWNICPLIWSNGGSLSNKEQTVATGFVNSPETVAAVELFANLYKENALTGFNSGDIPMTDGFGTNRYAMMLEGPWKTAELEGAYPDTAYGTAPMPVGKGGSISVLGGEDIAMFNQADKDAAWKFMQFMTSEFAQKEMAKCGQIPVSKAALNSDEVKKAPFAPFLDAIQTAKARPTVASWSEIDNEFSIAMHSVVSGEKSAQAAMDNLAKKIDELLKK